MGIIRYGSPMLHWQHEINRLFDDFDRTLENGAVEQAANGAMFRPAVDVREEKDSYTVYVEVPGVPRENLEIAMHDGALLIRGRKEARKESGESQFRRVERSYGSFARMLQLPRGIDADNISANLSDGVLEVRLPKLEQPQPRRIAIGSSREVEAQADSQSQGSAQA